MVSGASSSPATSRGAAAVPTAAPGSGVLQIVRSGPRSVVSRAFTTSPLKLLMPRNHGHAAWVYTANYGGGLVDGDALHVSIGIGRDATALLSTQASTKVYRSTHGTSMDVDAAIEDGGMLVVAPDPVVCFTRSRYRQTQQFRLARTAGLVLVDWLSSGRRAAGERWAFDSYAARAVVHCDGRLMLYDSLLLSGHDGDVATRLGRFDVVCLLVLIGSPLRTFVGRTLARVAETPVSRRSDLLIAASALGESGCLVRIVGVSVEAVGRTVRDYLRFVPSLLGDDPWTRKW